ncbi:MAG: indolepyruvate oxidoreductase subunit beta family protein, partial [Alphaproteobacteria bacterium]
MSAAQPVCVLIGALGGEGGGVLASWITQAALAQDLPVQSTSIPGVAQRTGATSYYLEIYPRRGVELAGKQPIFALFPNPGTVDIVVASELLEAARAMERGFVTPDRTTLIGSTHRIFAVAEKSVPSDGRFDATRAHAAAAELCKRAVLSDFAQLAAAHNTSLNAVLLGAIAGTGILPIEDDAFEDAIKAFGKARDANLRGFRAGIGAVRDPGTATKLAGQAAKTETKRYSPKGPRAQGVIDRAADYPSAVAENVPEAIARLVDFQDRRYATSYLKRLDRVIQAERDSQGEAFQFHLAAQVARNLAVWMSFEDVIRVADLKTRPDRLARVRDEVGVAPDQPLALTEFLKPGAEEWCGLLPTFIGRPLLNLLTRRNLVERFNVSVRVRTTGIFGFSMLFLLSRLRIWRRFSMRFREEQMAIEAWLDLLCRAMTQDYRFALEIAALP